MQPNSIHVSNVVVLGIVVVIGVSQVLIPTRNTMKIFGLAGGNDETGLAIVSHHFVVVVVPRILSW